MAATKKVLGFDPEQTFEVGDEVIATPAKLRERGQQAQDEWQQAFDAWAQANPERKALYDRMLDNELSPGWEDGPAELAGRPEGHRHPRRVGQGARPRIAPKLPELWGGSADLAESNNTTPEGEPSFLPTDRQTKTGPATRTAGCCTSASASTAWARS